MSHTIYTTEGLILKSVNFGEANKYFFIFTKEFGLIKAAAQGVRLLKSKLRYSLEDYSFGQISVVRGREIWRITSAEKRMVVKEKEEFYLLSRIFLLMLRLLHGEEKNELLFDSIKEGFIFLSLNKMSEQNLSNFECIIALRILRTLGYIGNLPAFEKFTLDNLLTQDLIVSMEGIKSQAIREINKSLEATHL